MYNSSGRQNDYPSESIDKNKQLVELVKKLTNLSDDDINVLLEVSHVLPFLSQLEGCDAYIDVMTKDNHLAVVVAQHSPPEGNFYNYNIVGDIMWRKNEPGVYRTLELGVPSRELKAVVYNEKIIVRQSVSAITNSDNEILGALIVEQNIQGGNSAVSQEETQQQEFFEAIYSEKEIQNIAEHMNDAMIRFNQKGVSIYANPKAKKLFLNLYYKDDIVGMSFENLAFGRYTFQDVTGKGQIEHTEIKIGQYYLNVRYISIWDESDFEGVILIIRDTTDIKSAEKELILKSTVIEEIHHRVKNNLQTIVSLIGLQANRTRSRQVKQFANNIISRIHSISITHEILAHNGVDSIDIKEMLSKMLISSKNYIVPDELNLDIQLTGDSMTLRSSTATTIAMVVNELIQNCIKHAFIKQKTGRILIKIEKGEIFSKITITDDGVGIQEAHHSGSMGLRLVYSLVKDKLKGSMEFRECSPGTEVCFTFICKGDY